MLIAHRLVVVSVLTAFGRAIWPGGIAGQETADDRLAAIIAALEAEEAKFRDIEYWAQIMTRKIDPKLGGDREIVSEQKHSSKALTSPRRISNSQSFSQSQNSQQNVIQGTHKDDRDLGASARGRLNLKACELTFLDPAICRSNRVDLEIVPRTSDEGFSGQERIPPPPLQTALPSLSSTTTCRYTLVVSRLACRAAALTSAKVRPQASAWLMNVCRPW